MKNSMWVRRGKKTTGKGGYGGRKSEVSGKTSIFLACITGRRVVTIH